MRKLIIVLLGSVILSACVPEPEQISGEWHEVLRASAFVPAGDGLSAGASRAGEPVSFHR
jgi:hypothetical protein